MTCINVNIGEYLNPGCRFKKLIGSTAEDEPDESDSGSILSVRVTKNAVAFMGAIKLRATIEEALNS